MVGHAGRLVIGTLAGKRVAALSGRAHFYEGHNLRTVTFATRVIGSLGVPTLILTNAAGGINLSFKPGTLMLMDDHINLMGTNPLVGPTRIASARDSPTCRRSTPNGCGCSRATSPARRGWRWRTASMSALHGPSYETPAEIRYLRTIGADAVGMSTVPEAIVARHMGIDVLGLSCITNMAAGVLPQPLVHDEVMEVARRVRAEFCALLEGIVERL